MISFLHVALAGLGLLLCSAAFAVWAQSKTTHLPLRLAFWPACAVLYATGLFLVLVGLGVDRWDDSSAWYWDTWLLFGSTCVVAMGYGVTRFNGALRSFIAVVPVVCFGLLVWFYLSM